MFGVRQTVSNAMRGGGPTTFGYIASLAYLTVAGTVIAFAMYLTLLKRIGAGRSGYS